MKADDIDFALAPLSGAQRTLDGLNREAAAVVLCLGALDWTHGPALDAEHPRQ
jgi:hypothetical protein